MRELPQDLIEQHNAESAEVWAASRSGEPTRVPVVGGVSIRHYLNIRDFETGFPTDFERLTAELGSAVTYRRTMHPRMLWGKTPEEIDEAAMGFVSPCVRDGLRLVVRTRNVIAPGTPLGNLGLFYRAAKRHGRYR